MISSNLGAEVFSQTKLSPNLENIWWVEVMLQKYKINGLVQMINKSKELTPKYISGYASLYKWSLREDSLPISGYKEAWLALGARYLDSPFPWVAWRNIICMPDIELLEKCIDICLKRGIRHLSYLSVVYANTEIDRSGTVTTADIPPMTCDSISEHSVEEWLETRKYVT